MGYFDKITENVFKEGENGEIIYSQRIINDPILKKKIFKFHKRSIKYLPPTGGLYGMLLGLGGGISLIGVMPVIILGMLVFLRKRILIRGLPIYGKKLNVKKAPIYMPLKLLIFNMISGVFLIILGLSMPFVLDKPISEIQTMVLIPVAVGACVLLLCIYVYKLTKSNNTSNNDAP